MVGWPSTEAYRVLMSRTIPFYYEKKSEIYLIIESYLSFLQSVALKGTKFRAI